MVAALSLVLLLMAEGVVRLLFPPPSHHDPYLRISSPAAVFGEVEVDGERRYRIVHPEAYLAKNTEFPVVKPADTIRVFCLGGSASAGWPHPPGESYGAYLRQLLQQAYPERKIEVVNASAHAFASYRVRLIFDEVIEFDPDLLIVYSGNNEFLERRSYRQASGASRWLTSVFDRLRLVQVLRDVLSGSAAGATLSGEGRTDTNYHVWTQIERQAIDMRADPEQFALALEHYRYSIEQMVSGAAERDVPVVLLTVPSNLRDWLPHVSAHQLDGAELEQWRDHYHHGRRQLLEGDYSAAVASLRRAAELEPGHAETRYFLARALEQVAPSDAVIEYRRAKDLDHNPFRAPSAFNDALRDVAAAPQGVVLVDLEELFDRSVAPMAPGFELFLDYVHPSRQGNLKIARAVFEVIAGRGLFGPAESVVSDDQLGLAGGSYRDDVDLQMQFTLLNLFSIMHQYESYLAKADLVRELIGDKPDAAAAAALRAIEKWQTGMSAYVEAQQNEIRGRPHDRDYRQKHSELYREMFFQGRRMREEMKKRNAR